MVFLVVFIRRVLSVQLKGKVMRNSMILPPSAFFPTWYLLQQLLPEQGNHALWAAMSVFMIARSLPTLAGTIISAKTF